MKRFFNYISIIFCIFLLVASNCVKSDDECHRYIEIINTSTNSIIYSTKLYNGLSTDSCLLTKTAVLEPGESYEQFRRTCWEIALKTEAFDIYIVDINGLDTTGLHDCDSIYYYNEILRHYRFDESDIDSLKSVDWIIRYP